MLSRLLLAAARLLRDAERVARFSDMQIGAYSPELAAGPADELALWRHLRERADRLAALAQLQIRRLELETARD